MFLSGSFGGHRLQGSCPPILGLGALLLKFTATSVLSQHRALISKMVRLLASPPNQPKRQILKKRTDLLRKREIHKTSTEVIGVKQVKESKQTKPETPKREIGSVSGTGTCAYQPRSCH